MHPNLIAEMDEIDEQISAARSPLAALKISDAVI
jgi:hypothetical protein